MVGAGHGAAATRISEPAFLAAVQLVADYLMPRAERVYGDAAASREDRNAATLARWIVKERAEEVYVRHLQREIRLPGLTTADPIHAAAAVLVEADWLREPRPAGQASPHGLSGQSQGTGGDQ